MKIKKEFLPEAFSGLGFFSATAVLIFFLSFRLVAADESSPSAFTAGDSFEYALVGIAHFDGISFASLIDRQTKIHFLLSSDKAQAGLKLISVGGDESAAGPSAIIEKGGISMQLKVEAGAGTGYAGSVVSSPTSFATPTAILPQPGSANLDLPKPPPGASLPLIFQAVDPKKLDLSPEQQQVIDQLRHDFLSAVNLTAAATAPASVAANSPAVEATANPSSANNPASSSQPTSNSNMTTSDAAANTQSTNWQTAQERSDEQLRTQIGWQAFSQYQLSLIK